MPTNDMRGRLTPPGVRHTAAALCLAAIAAACLGCGAAADEPRPRPAPSEVSVPASGISQVRTVRLSGILEAVRSTRVAVPAVTGPSFQMTLTRLVPNGSVVARGDVVAEFDPLEQLDQARQSAARYDDLSFQVRQKEADNKAAAERRRSERQQAEADLEKALLEVSKESVLSAAEAERNRIHAARARTQLESLDRRHPDEERADAAALRVLELQRDRQKAAYDRARANLEKLRVRAPIGGMVAYALRFNNGAMVRPQEGDRLSRNSNIMSIFDPGEMLVRVSVAEPDGALLRPGLEATVHVDAFPDVALPARFVSASPVAAAPVLSGALKSFRAIFRLEQTDPRLTPDLSAAVVFQTESRDTRPPPEGGTR
jgi:multidrug efflux pump subunit AcrA (membrane-fusion protein)